MVMRRTFAVLVALVAAAYIVRLATIMPYYGTDLDPIRYGARLLLRGGNPYEAIGPGRAVPWNYPLLYPMPALMLGMPFAALSLIAARAVFVGLLSGTCAYAVTRKSWVPALVFASASWWSAVGLAQWSPGLLAAVYAPALGFLIAAKPNVGLAVIWSAKTKRDALTLCSGALALTIAGFVIWPGWLPNWLGAIRDQPQIYPLIADWRHGGPLLLLAASRWREPRARLLLALALVPINPALYEGVLLFAVPTTVVEGAVLALCSWFVEPLGANGSAMLVAMMLPTLAILMRAHVVKKVYTWDRSVDVSRRL